KGRNDREGVGAGRKSGQVSRAAKNRRICFPACHYAAPRPANDAVTLGQFVYKRSVTRPWADPKVIKMTLFRDYRERMFAAGPKSLIWLIAFALLGTSGQAAPAAAADGANVVATVAVPAFWDPRRRPERPDLS